MEIRASVAMAVCNGEKYIEQQIDTIVDMICLLYTSDAADEL